ncbi:MAG: hypothetical protein Q8O88_00995 [bacterium]|nr:hypothetical protein [bacterium]
MKFLLVTGSLIKNKRRARNIILNSVRSKYPDTKIRWQQIKCSHSHYVRCFFGVSEVAREQIGINLPVHVSSNKEDDLIDMVCSTIEHESIHIAFEIIDMYRYIIPDAQERIIKRLTKDWIKKHYYFANHIPVTEETLIGWFLNEINN